MLPRHLDNVTGIAKAPYNFVELPNKIVEAKLKDLPDRNCYFSHLENKYTGRIKCKLTTQSPLYTRCGLTTEEFKQGKEAKDLPDFFYTFPDDKATKPVISGSSLRGMLRTLVEIVSFSKVERVTNNKLFYRSLGDPALKYIYMSNFVQKIPQVQHSSYPQASCYCSKVRAGFLHKHNNSYSIEECHYGRIDRKNINSLMPSRNNPSVYHGNGPSKVPSWDYQNKIIFVKVDSKEQDYFFPRQVNRFGEERHPNLYLRFRKVHSVNLNEFPGATLATLVVTGDMQHKHLEFVFLREEKPVRTYEISEDVVRRFHDDDQITKWQEDAFPIDKPNPNCRNKDGFLREGEPVFFLLNEDQSTVRFLGRAQMFRLPYDLSPFDLVPESLRDLSKIDIADTIFGYITGKEKELPRAGRVFISDAACVSNDNVWCKDFEDIVIPRILASPKPTTFQHYLVQTSANKKELKHYSPQSSEEKTVIRGHKLYWRKPDVKCENIEETDRKKIEKARSQYTKIKPIKAGVSFEFTIHFENLNDVELGALLWVLSISSSKAQEFDVGIQGEEYCLSLGMGKPLGMGAVKIDYEVYLSDRQERYSKLFTQNQWLMGEENQGDTTSKLSACVKAFEDYVVKNIDENDRPEGCKATKLNEIPRIQTLLAMLQCDNPPLAEETRYMTIESKEYKDRPVLPTPLQIKERQSMHDNTPRRMPEHRRERASANTSSTNTQVRKIEMPKKKSREQPQSRHNNSAKKHSDGASGGNPATARPPKPKR